MRFSNNYYYYTSTATTDMTWWSDNTATNFNQVTVSFKKAKEAFDKVKQALVALSGRLRPPRPTWYPTAEIVYRDQIPAVAFALRRSANWRGHTGWTRLGSRRPL